MSIAIGMSFAASFMMLATIGVVLFLPMLAPRLIEGLTVAEWSLARPLLVMVLLPLLIGVAIRESAPNAAAKLLSAVSKIGMLFLLITLVIYGRDLLGLVGSFAPGAQVLFFVAITALSYTIHFGLTQPQRGDRRGDCGTPIRPTASGIRTPGTQGGKATAMTTSMAKAPNVRAVETAGRRTVYSMCAVPLLDGSDGRRRSGDTKHIVLYGRNIRVMCRTPNRPLSEAHT